MAVLADSHAALLGQGCTTPGLAKATYGTGTSVMTPVAAFVGGDSPVPATLAWLTDQPTFAREGNILSSGSTLASTAELLGLEHVSHLVELAAQVDSTAGVILVPAFTGLGAPHWDRTVQASVTGLTSASTRAHVARAAVEAVAHQVCDVVDVIEADGQPLTALRADGGATASELLMQTQADLLGRRLEVADVAEASALGAAQLGLVGLGHPANWAGARSPSRSFEPRPHSRSRGATRGLAGGDRMVAYPLPVSPDPATLRADRPLGVEREPSEQKGSLPMVDQLTGPGPVAADGQVRLMTKVAHLYHEQGMRQSDIAEALHISQARVSRLLKRATELGIVRTIVVVSQGVHTDLEQALEETFGLAEAVVVDAETDEASILRALGSAGASYLETALTGGERLGISSWSATLLAVVDRLQPLRTPGADSVVQLVGGVGVSSVQAQANRLLGELTELIGASPTFVPAPGLVGSSANRTSLINDPAMESVAAQWEQLTMALVGIGSLQPSQLLRASGNAIAADDQRALGLGRRGRRHLPSLLRRRRRISDR